MITSEPSWLERAKKSMDDGLYPCQSCGNRLAFIQLKEFKGQKLCPACLKAEREKKKSEKQAGLRSAVDMAAIEAVIKSAIGEAVKGINISRIESAVENLKDELKNEIQRSAEKPAESFYVPGSPSETRLFYEICKNKRVVGGNLERNFGIYNASLVHIRLLSMWHDNLLWKDRHGWFMINPEMTKQQLEIAVGVPLKNEEYDDYMIEMRHQAINFKFRPLAILGEKKQKEVEREMALLTP